MIIIKECIPCRVAVDPLVREHCPSSENAHRALCLDSWQLFKLGYKFFVFIVVRGPEEMFEQNVLFDIYYIMRWILRYGTYENMK